MAIPQQIQDALAAIPDVKTRRVFDFVLANLGVLGTLVVDDTQAKRVDALVQSLKDQETELREALDSVKAVQPPDAPNLAPLEEKLGSLLEAVSLLTQRVEHLEDMTAEVSNPVTEPEAPAKENA